MTKKEEVKIVRRPTFGRGSSTIGPWKWDGEMTINGRGPVFEIGEWVTVESSPDTQEHGDPLGTVPETYHMIGDSFEVIDIKWMIHPRSGRQFIYGLHYAFVRKIQYFWRWNLVKDKGR